MFCKLNDAIELYKKVISEGGEIFIFPVSCHPNKKHRIVYDFYSGEENQEKLNSYLVKERV